MSKQRLLCFDVIRAIAIIFVVFCHSSSHLYALAQTGLERTVLLIFFTIGRIGVPLFLLLTGYFLLDKTYSTKDIKKFYKEKWVKLFITAEIWLAIYYLLSTLYRGEPFSIIQLLSQCAFLRPSTMNHAWYFGMILGFYLTIPFVANAIHSLKNLKVLVFPMTILIVYIFCVPFLKIFNNNLIPSFYDGFIGGYYGIYIIFGYLLKRGFLKNIKSFFLLISTILAFVATVAINSYTMHKTGDFGLWYNNIFLLVVSLGLFELISRRKNIRFGKSWSLIAYHSFSIFLLHNIVRLYFNVDIKNCLVYFVIETITMFCVSIAISIVVKRFGGKAGKILLYLK